MAPAGTTNAAGRPKRKRQRRRRANADSDDDLDLSSSSSESGSSSSSSDSDSDDDKPTTTKATAATTAAAPAKAAAASSSSSSSDDDDAGADSDSSSGSDLSFLSDGGGDLGGRGRRGRGRRRAAEGAEAAAAGAAGGAGAAPGSAPHAAAAQARRPYPERSPSPSMLARADPSAFVPLGTSLFPLLDKRVPKTAAATGEEDGAEAGAGRVLDGLVEGDEAGAEAQEDGKKREDRFGEWWRARLVSEFEGDLGGLAAEPGLTPSRLQLLLTSLTTLSSLHTSSALSPSARSIWAHDASATLDPLATLPASASGDDLAEWATTRVGGAGDVEVGEEGVVDDERRSAKHKAKKERRKSAPVPEAVKMVVEAEGAAAPASSPAKKDKKEKKRKGRKSGVSEAGDRMEVDE
ncbi:hypothetical protein JCM8208_006692 [Rhodotorula glutinis]